MGAKNDSFVTQRQILFCLEHARYHKEEKWRSIMFSVWVKNTFLICLCSSNRIKTVERAFEEQRSEFKVFMFLACCI